MASVMPCSIMSGAMKCSANKYIAVTRKSIFTGGK